MAKQHDNITFRLIQTPCCGYLLCWVNPRLPTYCPECSKPLLGHLKGDPSKILLSDPKAVLTFNPQA